MMGAEYFLKPRSPLGVTVGVHAAHRRGVRRHSGVARRRHTEHPDNDLTGDQKMMTDDTTLSHPPTIPDADANAPVDPGYCEPERFAPE